MRNELKGQINLMTAKLGRSLMDCSKFCINHLLVLQ